MKRLILVRHAEAQFPCLVAQDRDRALVGEGLKQLDVIGKQLHGRFLGVDYALCSNAKRARQTFNGIRKHLPDTIQISYEDKLYNANFNAILDRIRRIEERYRHVLIVGHNPGMQQALDVVQEYNPPSFPVQPFKTGSSAFFELHEDLWSSLTFKSFKLVEQILATVD